MESEVIAQTTSDYEIERGKPMPSKNHAMLQIRIAVLLSVAYDKKYDLLSEISLNLMDWKSTPDIAIYPKMKFNFMEDEIRMTEPPLGVIEILSPRQSLQDLTDKTTQYFMQNVQSVWLVLPALQSIYVFENAETSEVYTPKHTLKDKKLDIELPLDEIFR